MKVKVKLRDMTPEQWIKWERKKCASKHFICDKCPFQITTCHNALSKSSWLNNKDMFSDKFLDQEVEIEEE